MVPRLASRLHTRSPPTIGRANTTPPAPNLFKPLSEQPKRPTPLPRIVTFPAIRVTDPRRAGLQ